MNDQILGWTGRHHELRSEVEQFAHQNVVPVIADIEATEGMPREIFAEMGRAGLLGGTIEKKHGGRGLTNVELCVLIEEMGRYSQPIAGLLGGASTVFGVGLANYGTQDQIERYLRPYLAGESLGGFALTESRSGSDAAGMETIARKVEGGWVLDGGKDWIDGATVADWFIVFARTDVDSGKRGISAFLVDADIDGLSATEYRNKLGWRAASVGSLKLHEVVLDDDALLGAPGEGYRIAMSSVGYGRLQVAARLAGGIGACLDASREFAQERVVFGQSIAHLQLVQTKIVDMSIARDTARFLTYRYAQLLDAGEIARREGSMAKLYAAEAFMRVSHDAVQIHGAHGVHEDAVVGRMFRDAKISEIVEGSNEVQRTLVAEFELGLR